MMLGLDFCFSAVVTDNSRDTTDRNQRSCILKRNKIYDASTLTDILSMQRKRSYALMLVFKSINQSSLFLSILPSFFTFVGRYK